LVTAARLATLNQRVSAQEQRLQQTNAPVPMPAVLHGREWLLSRPAGHYTIQLLGAHRRERLILLTEEMPLPGVSAYYQHTHEEKDWYVLVSGDYPGFSHAFKALRALPAPWNSYGPWIREFSSIQRELAVREP